MALTVADDEVLEALKVFWDANSSLGGEFGLLQSGRLASPQLEEYCAVKSELGQSPRCSAPMQSGQPYLDCRRVTFTGYGTRERMAELGRALLAQLAWLPRNGRTLKLPVPTVLCVIRPLGDPGLIEDDTRKSGKDVWQCVWETEIDTTRILP